MIKKFSFILAAIVIVVGLLVYFLNSLQSNVIPADFTAARQNAALISQDIVNLTVDDQGALVYVARMITDDRFHVVHGGVMSADGYFEIGDITVKSNEGLTFDAMNEYHQVVSVWNSIEHRREFGSLAHHITKRGVNYDDPSLQRTPEMPIKPARKCGGFDLSEYIIAQNEPLAVLKSEDGVRICWGNDVTRTFKKVESLAFENGKVSYLAQNSDETWQVVWNGVEGKKFTSIRYYDLVNGNPQYWGQAVDSHFYVVNGASASQPYGEVKLYQYGFGKQLYVARKLDPAAKLNTSSPQRKI